MHKQQAEQQAQQQQINDADKAYAAMEEMLGKAAAKAWKAARDAALTASAQQDPASAAGGDGNKQLAAGAAGAGAGDSPARAVGRLDKFGSSFGRSVSSRSMETAGATAGANEAEEGVETPSSPGSLAGQEGSGAGSSAAASAVPTPRTAAANAAAASASLMAAAAAAPNPAEALKLQLAALGVRDPADVSRRLLEEVGVRAELEWLLAAVAAQLDAKGLPWRLSKKSSMKITRALNKRWVVRTMMMMPGAFLRLRLASTCCSTYILFESHTDRTACSGCTA